MPIILVSVILLLAVVLLVTEKVPVDLTAIGIMAVLMVLQILSPEEALGGFANPAPITVALLFVVSRALMRTGALDFITTSLIRYSRGRENRLLFMSLFIVGGFSSFLNNTPVVVLFISVIIAVCSQYRLSPSKFLLPISFVSILAGTSTLIGTSTNILVSDLAAQSGHAPIGMFELSLLGIPTAMVGAVFLYFVSPRLLRAHREPVLESTGGDKVRYISELVITETSQLVGGDALGSLRQRFPDITLYEILRGEQVIDPNLDPTAIQPGDVLLIKATAPQLAQILANRCARLAHVDDDDVATNPHKADAVIVELLVQPNSDAVGSRLSQLLASLDAHVRVIGVKRHWTHFQPEKVSDLRLAVGDILLVQTPLDHLDPLRRTGDLLVLEDVHQTILNKKKAPVAMLIFAVMVVVAAFGLADILVAAFSATLLMLATGCLSLREGYRSLDARILVLIIGTISLGTALGKTGAADLYAQAFLSLFEGMSPQVVLSAFILLTSLLSMFLSNNSTAVLLLPIALSTATALGVDARPFVIGICFGASACYATPIGYQTNLLVYGPGGYRFSDFLKLGIPLNIFVWIVSSIFVPMIWPF